MEDEEEFFFLNLDNVAMSYDEKMCICVGKPIADYDVNVQRVWRCLCKAWRQSDFKFCKIDVCTYQFYFQEFDTMMAIITGGA